MKLRKIAAFIIAGALLCMSAVPIFAAEEPDVVIYYTNDIHGYFEGVEGNIGHDRIAGIYETTKEENINTYLISAGDMIQGTYFVNNNRGEAAMDIMSAAGYQAMTLGNHEFDFGTDRILELRSMFDNPAFMTQAGFGGIHWAAPVIFETDDYTVGFFGITSPDTQESSNGGRDIDFGTKESLVTYANDTASSLKADGVDLVICVAHMGVLDEGFGTIYDLRDATSGIDLFIDGHSHTQLSDITEEDGKPLIVSAGEYGQELGKVTFTPDENGGFKAAAVSITPEEAYATELSEGGKAKEAEVKAVIDKWAAVADEKGNEVIAVNETELKFDRPTLRTSESALGDFTADAIRAVSGADIGLMNGGSIKGDLHAGDITVADINTILPYINYIVMAEVDGKTLRATLEHSVSEYPVETGGFLQISGAAFTFNPSAKPGSRVIDITVGGTPLDDNAIYTVATNDWISGGGDGYAVLVPSFDKTLPLAHPETTTLTEAVAWYIGTNPEIPSGTGRIDMVTNDSTSEDISAPATSAPATGNTPLYVMAAVAILALGGAVVSRKK
ncbi:MAG: 5'-nucleotidase C-terminal domain-containing protein [Ruminococcus sp.]|jgi:2',3'-cyclic-nucleotide 2'-phosphodiesterase (5'-nucleotidase family)|nr:5'-nucleotidase C-terminal domain-containing protein [Ruminococcus sp.]